MYLDCEAGSSPKQVSTEHYLFSSYLTVERWSSYWHQLKEILDRNPKKVLLIGIGDNILPVIMQSKGIEVTTFDFDQALEPDFAGDVRHIDCFFLKDSFDVVVCCQVLEHLEFAHFEEIIEKLLYIAKDKVLLSLPYSHRRFFELSLKLPKLPSLSWVLDIPTFWEKWVFNGEHYWEVGTKGYPKRKIDDIIQALTPRSKIYFATYKYHLFYVLDSNGVR